MISKRNGNLTRYYRESDGAIMEAWSYSTCILARMEPDEDFPKGRLVLNERGYSPTTWQHFYKTVRPLYDTEEYDNRAIVIDTCHRETPESLIQAVKDMQQSVTEKSCDVYEETDKEGVTP